jgi:hypothetical protein
MLNWILEKSNWASKCHENKNILIKKRFKFW